MIEFIFQYYIVLNTVLSRFMKFEFHRNLMNYSQSGFSMIYALGVVGVISASTVATLQKVDNSAKVVTVNRAYQRKNMLEDKVRRASESATALYATASALKSGALHDCVVKRNCRPTKGKPIPYTLRNSVGIQLSNTGFFFNGAECNPKKYRKQKNAVCPLLVRTSYKIECAPNEFSCSIPKKIVTKYSVVSNPSKKYRGPKLKRKDRETSLAGFRCPPKQYMIGVNDAGMPQCRTAEYISPESALQCSHEGEVPTELAPNGAFVCGEPPQCFNAIDTVLVIDKSGSMKRKDKMKKAKKAAKDFINKMRPQDRMSIVTFSKESKKVIDFTSSKESLRKVVDKLKAKGSTNMTAGLKDADEITNHASITSARKPVIIFLSDGIHNRGKGPGKLAGEMRENNQKRKKAKKKSKKIISIAFGKGADQKELKNIASDKKNFHDARDLSIEKTFGQISKDLCR